MEAGRARMTFWTDGRRATRPESAPKSGRQIVVLGCSLTQGYGLPDNETFAYQLSTLAPDWDVENFGTGGYGAYQSLLTLKRIFSEGTYSPKLVVYAYVHFHANRDVAAYDWIKGFTNVKGELFVPPNVVAESGHLVAEDFRVFPLWPHETDLGLVAIAKLAYVKLRYRGRERFEDEVTRILLTEMRTLSTSHGARFVVMELSRAPESLETFLNSNGFDVANCPDSDPELKLEDKAFRVGGHGHPNGKANKSFARCIHQWMDQHLSGDVTMKQ